MRRKVMGLVGILLLCTLAVSLVVVPVTADGPTTDVPPTVRVYFDPAVSSAPFCNTVQVGVFIETSMPLANGKLVFQYQNTCAEVVDYSANDADWNMNGANLSELGKVTITFMNFSPTGTATGPIKVGDVFIHCICNAANDVDLVWDQGESYLFGLPGVGMIGGIVWEDGVFSCEGGAPPPTVVSGKLGTTSGEVDGIPTPPGYVPCDEFLPGEVVYVWGTGTTCNWYDICIQPYQMDTAVVEGDTINPASDPSTGYQRVHIVDGTFGPVAIWTVPDDQALVCTTWEIVADHLGSGASSPDENPASGVGIYNGSQDGLDAIASDEYGFHIFPEAATIVLLLGGLAALSGFLIIRRRRAVGSQV